MISVAGLKTHHTCEWLFGPFISGVVCTPLSRAVRKTYFSDNDNEKGKYSDGNSPIRRVGCARVENIKRRVLLSDIFRHALLLLLTHGAGCPFAVNHFTH